MRNLKTIIIAVASVSAIGYAVNAFAHGGKGWAGCGGHHSQGWQHRGEYCPKLDHQLSKAQFIQIEQIKEAFFKDTRQLRANLHEKRRELQTELAHDELDASKVSGLQKEISELQAQFDQKRIDHMVEMRKLTPNGGCKFMRGGPMMGKRASKGGCCWQ
jgi:Spy/CpxP family protein refolding chaperone